MKSLHAAVLDPVIPNRPEVSSTDRVERRRRAGRGLPYPRLVQANTAVRAKIDPGARPPTEPQRHSDRPAKVRAASGAFDCPVECNNCSREEEPTERGQGATDIVSRFTGQHDRGERKHKPSEKAHRGNPPHPALEVGANRFVHGAGCYRAARAGATR